MSKELVAAPAPDESYNLLADFDYVQNASKKLMQSKHYQTLGEEGVFAIVQAARSLNVNPILALNGGLTYLRGKVGMSAELMSSLIRSKGHSLIVDPKSNDQMCIVHGKRADNGDTCTVSFSIEDAKRAGIYANTWTKYPGDMCFNRCISKIKRRLFSDIAMNMYENDEVVEIQGEWSDSKKQAPINYVRPLEIEAPKEEPELGLAEIQEFYRNFNGDENMTREYVAHCQKVKKWSASKVIQGLTADLEESQKTYENWKRKELKKRAAEAASAIDIGGSGGIATIEPTSMEPKNLFDEEGK